MAATESDQRWTGGDPVSHALIHLAADRALPSDFPIRAGLVELAQRHGLVGVLANQTKSDLVRAIHARELARQTAMESHLRQVLFELDDAGVRVAVLKGPAIAEHYRRPEFRSFSDLDLLVPPGQLDKALEVTARNAAAVEVPAKRPRADKRDVVFRDASGFQFNLDLHWDLFSYSQLRGRADGATAAAWDGATQRPESPWGPIWELPAAYQLAFLSTHAVLDHRFRLILFRDFLELVGGEIQWLDLGQVATRWGLRSTTYLALWVSRDALGVPVPEDFLASLRPRSAPLRFLESALPRVDLGRFDGHRPHPVNLAAVLLNDFRSDRFALLLRAPAAFPQWRKRVAEGPRPGTPRTLILVSTDMRRGAEVAAERLRDGLQARGWVVEAVGLRSAGAEPRADVETLVDSTAVGGRRFDFEVVRALRKKIRSFGPDLVIANGGATLRYGLAARIGLRFSLTYIGIGEPSYWIRSRLSRWLNRMMLRRTDQVLAVSEATRLQLLELEPTLNGRIHATYTGVPPDLLEIHGAVSSGPLRVLMIGSLTHEKDPARALRVVANMDDAIIRLVGSGSLLEELQELAAFTGVDDRVEFVGSVSDVVPHLEWAHLLLLTSLSEGLPGAILEASAAGLPTVAVDVGGVREAVVDGKTGFITNRNDAELLVALRKLDANRDLLEGMGRAARQHVKANFLLEDVIDNYANVLMKTSR